MQVIAHRMNSLTLARQALDLGCDWLEIDVWQQDNGAFAVTRTATEPGDDLSGFLALPAGLYIDAKRADAAGLSPLLQTRERTVVWAPELDWLARLPSPLALPQALNAEHLHEALTRLQPTHVAFDHRDFTPELAAIAKAAGAQIFVDRLRENDNPWKWEEAQAWGADAIQTDRPRELLKWLGR